MMTWTWAAQDQEREAKRALRAELNKPKDAAYTGMVLVKAR
jgi:hypothetical protein